MLLDCYGTEWRVDTVMVLSWGVLLLFGINTVKEKLFYDSVIKVLCDIYGYLFEIKYLFYSK